jgi:hypothetical protein
MVSINADTIPEISVALVIFKVAFSKIAPYSSTISFTFSGKESKAFLIQDISNLSPVLAPRIESSSDLIFFYVFLSNSIIDSLYCLNA